MKTRLKKITAIAMVLAAIVILSSCSFGGASEKMTASSVTELVQGNLDEIYLGEFDDDYLDMVDITRDEAEEVYITGLEAEAERFASFFAIEYMTDDIKEQIVDLLKEIYSHASYTVEEASKLDDTTYAVRVLLEPLDIFQLAYDSYEEALEPLYEKYAGTDISAMTEEEYQVYDAEWAQVMIDLCRDKLPDMGYMDEKSIGIQVIQDDDGLWTISQDDFYTFDEQVLYYPTGVENSGETTSSENEDVDVESASLGEQNALESALSYLSFSSFSYTGLIDQLEFEGYSLEEATYAADNCGADWYEQAAKTAQSYLDVMSVSRQGLIEQLENEGFTTEQAEYSAKAVGY